MILTTDYKRYKTEIHRLLKNTFPFLRNQKLYYDDSDFIGILHDNEIIAVVMIRPGLIINYLFNLAVKEEWRKHNLGSFLHYYCLNKYLEH